MSTRSWSSASWYRVSNFRPRLRAHTSIYRHTYRGSIWYVLQDRVSGRFHRFTPSAYRVIALMDGERSLDEIWEISVGQLEVDAVTQDEIVRLVGQLYSADVLAGDVPPDIVELSDRGRRMERQKFLQRVLNPLAVRVPVLDPDEFLSATWPLVQPVFTIFGAILYLMVVGYGAVLAAIHFDQLTADFVDRVIAAQNIVLVLLAYPFVKALHELGHAYTIKRWGGTVHEIGVMFLVFMPVPYVDASDSLAFTSKWRRALVGAAGILVEMLLAAIAMIVWQGAEDGLVRAFAFNVMLIGGVSTLLFNGNPLLRFDGYYVLCDILEIPNLGQRANRYLSYLVQRHLFGLQWVENPANARGEPFWFVSYATAAFTYRLFITTAIIGLVATRFFIVGTILAAWAAFLMLGLPILKGLWFVISGPALRRNRGRALSVVGSLMGGIALLVLAVPIPYNTVAQGVVSPPPEASANAMTEGVVAELYAHSDQTVSAGDPILRLEDPLLSARRDVVLAKILEYQRRLESQALSDQNAKRILEEELDAATSELAVAESRIEDLTLRAGASGVVVIPDERNLVGQFVRRGDRLAIVADFRDPVIHLAIPEAQADLVKNNTWWLDVRLAGYPDQEFRGRVVRVAPGLSTRLPDPALSKSGGGDIALDPSAPPGTPRAIGRYLNLDVALEGAPAVQTYGNRAYVRFNHGSSPLSTRLYRTATRVFLKYFAAPTK